MRGYTTQSGVQIPDKTEWHNIVAWRGLAEVAEKYVRKGTQLYIEGKIRTARGRTRTRFAATQPRFMSTTWSAGRRDSQSASASTPQAAPAQAQPAGYQTPSNPGFASTGGNSGDDDLPF